jgi:hypothetical protein
MKHPVYGRADHGYWTNYNVYQIYNYIYSQATFSTAGGVVSKA